MLISVRPLRGQLGGDDTWPKAAHWRACLWLPSFVSLQDTLRTMSYELGRSSAFLFYFLIRVIRVHPRLKIFLINPHLHISLRKAITTLRRAWAKPLKDFDERSFYFCKKSRSYLKNVFLCAALCSLWLCGYLNFYHHRATEDTERHRGFWDEFCSYSY